MFGTEVGRMSAWKCVQVGVEGGWVYDVCLCDACVCLYICVQVPPMYVQYMQYVNGYLSCLTYAHYCKYMHTYACCTVAGYSSNYVCVSTQW